MTDHNLVLFPDTNLFIQCKPLEELDWSEWKNFAEVHLRVCRTVTREIDDQKPRGNSRVAQRARATYQLFGQVLESEQGYLLIRNSDPTVKLFVEGVSQQSTNLDDQLDYTKPDDQIVGRVHKFRQDNPHVDTRLLTQDRGPMMTARHLELPYVQIREDWLLQPENDDSEKKIIQLRNRVAQLEKAEPRFKIEIVGEDGKTLERLEVEHLIYEPLPDSEIDTLVESLTNQLPMRTNFTPDEPAEDEKGITTREGLDRKDAIGPPKDEDIAKYRDQDYPNWTSQCRMILSDLHKELQRQVGQPTFEIAVTNEGTRPGNDALVVVNATGNFKICPPPYKGESDEDSEGELALPRPPRPPVGPKAPSPSHGITGLSGIIRPFGLFQRTTSPFNFGPIHLPPPIGPSERRRDPNEFFYKPDIPSEPGESFSLECEQWRHSRGPELFIGEIFFGTEQEEVRGLLRCEVHAENLSAPVSEQFPVRVAIRRVTSKERARELVQKLIGPRI